MDVLADAPAPATAVEACLPGGFVLGTGARLVGAGGCGALLVGGEAFAWRPWEAGVGVGDGDGGKKGSLVNEKGQWEVADEAWAIFGVVWPRPGKSYFFFFSFLPFFCPFSYPPSHLSPRALLEKKKRMGMRRRRI